MKTRILTAAVMLPFFLAVLLVFPPIVLTLVLSVISAFAAFELFGAVNRTCKKTPSSGAVIYTMIASAMIPFVIYLRNLFATGARTAAYSNTYPGELAVFFILMCLVLVDFFLSLKSDKRIRLRQLLIMPVAAFIIPYMLSSLLSLQFMPDGRLLVMLPVVVTVLTDSGAYFTGVTIGKHKIMPKISPNKTLEGFIGGIISGIAGMLIYGFVIQMLPAAGVTADTASAAVSSAGITPRTVNYAIMLLYGLVGALVTEMGDLTFSLIKRKCNIKDYGSIFPGHGGALDRFDSICFSAPAMLLLVTLLPAF